MCICHPLPDITGYSMAMSAEDIGLVTVSFRLVDRTTYSLGVDQYSFFAETPKPIQIIPQFQPKFWYIALIRLSLFLCPNCW